ncbi:MAG: cytidylyltransferase domain-containing protein [Desulfovibrio sp.]
MKVQSVIQIPARSGSTRLKHKNIMQVNGLPLIAYTILMAKRLTGVDRVIVNTDSAEYAEVAKEFGAEVPILRPAEIAGEKASLHDTFVFMENWLKENEQVKISKHMFMYPTSPFRNLQTIQKYVDTLDEYEGVNVNIRTPLDVHKLCVEDDGLMHYIAKPEKPCAGTWMKSIGTFHAFNGMAKKPHMYFILTNPYELIDIDTAEDVRQMQDVLDHNLYDFGFDLWS